MAEEVSAAFEPKQNPTANFYDLKGKPRGLELGKRVTITVTGEVTDMGMNDRDGKKETYRCTLSDVEIGGSADPVSMTDQIKKAKRGGKSEYDE